jgi:hypothetical protein
VGPWPERSRHSVRSCTTHRIGDVWTCSTAGESLSFLPPGRVGGGVCDLPEFTTGEGVSSNSAAWSSAICSASRTHVRLKSLCYDLCVIWLGWHRSRILSVPVLAPDMVVIRLGNAFGTRLKETGGGLVFELIESWAFEAVFIPRNRDCYGSEGSMNTG